MPLAATCSSTSRVPHLNLLDPLLVCHRLQYQSRGVVAFQSARSQRQSKGGCHVMLWARSRWCVTQAHRRMGRVGRSRVYATYMDAYLVMSLPKNNVYAPCIHRVGQNHIYTVYYRILDGFPAKITVYIPYIYGSGQLYVYMAVANCTHRGGISRWIQPSVHSCSGHTL